MDQNVHSNLNLPLNTVPLSIIFVYMSAYWECMGECKGVVLGWVISVL